MDNDTILFVLGDHGSLSLSLHSSPLFLLRIDNNMTGMTPDGNHGGASEDEVGAALLVFSPRQINDRLLPRPDRDFNQFRSVAQIDLVPTLSLLLGVPIPFARSATREGVAHHAPVGVPVPVLYSCLPRLPFFFFFPLCDLRSIGTVIPELFLRSDLNEDLSIPVDGSIPFSSLLPKFFFSVFAFLLHRCSFINPNRHQS